MSLMQCIALQVAVSASAQRDGTAKVSRLATAPDPRRKREPIEASKGMSALERARKKRKDQSSAPAASAAADPLTLLDDLFQPP